MSVAKIKQCEGAMGLTSMSEQQMSEQVRRWSVLAVLASHGQSFVSVSSCITRFTTESGYRCKSKSRAYLVSDSYWPIDGQSHIQSNQAKRGQGDISKCL